MTFTIGSTWVTQIGTLDIAAIGAGLLLVATVIIFMFRFAERAESISASHRSVWIGSLSLSPVLTTASALLLIAAHSRGADGPTVAAALLVGATGLFALASPWIAFKLVDMSGGTVRPLYVAGWLVIFVASLSTLLFLEALS